MRSLLLGSLFFNLLSLSQKTFAQTLNLGNPFGEYGFLKGGKVIYSKSDFLEEGNYMYPTQPVKTTVYLQNGKTYPNVKAFLNLQNNELQFLDNAGQLLSPTEPVATIEFYPDSTSPNKTVFKNGFPPVEGLLQNTFYEVLAEGKISLLKFYKITYVDKSPIERSTSVRTYMTDNLYYVYDKDKVMHQIKKRRKDIIDFLKDKNEKVVAFIKENNTNFNSDNDLAALFQYYNTL